MPIQAYETIHRGQIRGMIYCANGLTSGDLMANLTCYWCEIVSARPMGNKGAALIKFEGPKLPHKIHIYSVLLQVVSYQSRQSVNCAIKLDIGKILAQLEMSVGVTAAAVLPTVLSDNCAEKTNPICRFCGGKHLATDRECPVLEKATGNLEMLHADEFWPRGDMRGRNRANFSQLTRSLCKLDVKRM